MREWVNEGRAEGERARGRARGTARKGEIAKGDRGRERHEGREWGYRGWVESERI